MKPLYAVEMCAGAGGQALGLEMAGRPVVIGLMFPQGLSKITMEDAKGGTREHRFSHAVLIKGFATKTGSRQDTTYEILNSWRKEWGDQGYGTLTARWGIQTAFSAALD